MSYENIILDLNDGIATITLNRPAALNALDMQLAREFHQAVVACSENDDVRVVVVTGSGNAFCAGGDVKGFCEHIDTFGVHAKLLTTELHGAVSRMVRMAKPTITAVNGVAAGGGMSLALSGDLILATESARFTMAYTQVGLAPDGSSTYWLPRLIGGRRTLELMLTNRRIEAEEALAWGLVNRVVAPDCVEEEALAFATQLANGPTEAFGLVKKLVLASAGNTLETQMELESRAIADASRTADAKEGMAAFFEKRDPTFQGR